MQEAARAFTGWFVVRDEFAEVPRQHDDGPKTVLGRKGDWAGDDIPAILLDQPACAEFICRKLFRHFVSELAGAVRCPDRPARQRVPRVGLPDPRCPWRRSCARTSSSTRPCGGGGSRCPVEFAVGTIRSLEILKPTVQAAALAEVLCPDGPEPVCAAERRGLGWRPGPGSTRRRCWPGPTCASLCSPINDEALGRRCDPAKPGRAARLRRPAEAAGFFLDLLAAGAARRRPSSNRS